ncbi:MarR family winged helix-turn-helix transcriptional regulator [Nocardia concava]|uniref:MarR family winged helix-turn-helix transcriptional regulator n=1 Tax=Nocardia concava TaxID=257281 RepID=UPI00030117B0|nr:MarR family transcriptional regulator [Nocardia concava]
MQLTQATELLPDDTGDRLADIVVAVSRLNRLAGVVGGVDLPHAVMRALGTLDEYGALRISQFARIDRCSQPAATALIARLTEAGLARRTKDPDDSRAVVVELTSAGRDRLAAAREQLGNSLAARLPDIDPALLNRLRRDLHGLTEALKAAGA